MGNVTKKTKEDDLRFHSAQRTEEVQDIIERIPTKFGYIVATLVTFILLLLLFFGIIIRYPDIIYGKITINTTTAPIKLVANTTGKIVLNIKHSLDPVKEGDVIAYIESAASYESIIKIKQLLNKYNPGLESNFAEAKNFPHHVSLGMLTPKYYAFLNSLYMFNNFVRDKLYEKRLEGLQRLVEQQKKERLNAKEKTSLSNESLQSFAKMYKRDSILYDSKAYSESDLDRSKMSYLSAKSAQNSTLSEQLRADKEFIQTQNQIKEVQIQKDEKYKELKLSLISTFNDLEDNIKSWEQAYTIRAPFAGQVQFLKFWETGQFVQGGESLFTIIPSKEEPYGQVIISTFGAGKIRLNQEVVIKLDNFPYTEYGTISGVITGISKTTNIEKTTNGEMETYMLDVKLSNGLLTNYGKKLDFMHETRGSAEIITNDRKLLERFFDNLRYILDK